MGGGNEFPTGTMASPKIPITPQEVDEVLRGKYPAKQHALNVLQHIKDKGGCDSREARDAIFYLEGQKTKMIEDNDEAQHFRQRRHFYYLTGCDLPDCYFVFDTLKKTSILFIPPIDPHEVIWSGLPIEPEDAIKIYDVDEVRTTDQIDEYLATHPSIFAIKDQVNKEHKFVTPYQDLVFLKEAIEECRVIKDTYEIALTRKANIVSTIAHTAVLKAAKKAKNERELEAIFVERSIANGCRDQAYHSIVASGTAAATLHYVKNDQPLEGKLNILLDAGGQYGNYSSDITRTFPISGSFSEESRAIYDIVLRMQVQCIEKLKAGVHWDDIHILAHKIAIDGLLELGILKGDKDEILKTRTSVAFFPHGLGHYLGMDTHDTGGHPNYDDEDEIFQNLRVRGSLPAGSIITVEPGIYFCQYIIQPVLDDEKHAKFIDQDVLEKYVNVGGVRIEDNVLITEDGYVNLTDTPKEAAEIMQLINSA